MNALRVAIVTFGTVLLSSTFQVTDATSCELMKIFAAVKPLESSTDIAACMAATGYEMLPPSGPPTDAQIAKLCGTNSCQSVFTTLQKMNIPDCTIDILGGLNVKQTFAGIITKCGGPITGGSTSMSTPSSTTSTTQASQPLAAATPAPPAKANGNASSTPAMTAAPVPATTSAPAATTAPSTVTTSAPATTAPSAKATTATSTPASSTTSTTAPSKAGASTGTVHAAGEPTLEPQMCV